MHSFVCRCQKGFYGDVCQNEKSSIQIQLAPFSFANDTLASVVQYYDVNNATLKLILRHQQVFFRIPSHLRLYDDQMKVPIIGVLKLHGILTNANYYILYIQPNKTVINITSVPQHCPHAFSLVHHGKIRRDTAVFSLIYFYTR